MIQCVSDTLKYEKNMHAFSSHHSGGANFCFADGSVHAISEVSWIFCSDDTTFFTDFRVSSRWEMTGLSL